MSKRFQEVSVVDSHTGGESTRIVISGGPDLGSGAMAERLERLRGQHDCFRSAVVNEPRGSDVMVGGLLCQPTDRTSTAAVIFFNNVGYLGMCGHGTIGLVATLSWLGRIGSGQHRIETPVGTVTAELHETGEVTITNVASYRAARDVCVNVPGHGPVTGDVAWGGNWFFLIKDHHEELALERVEELTDFAWRIRLALKRQGITGDSGAEIDHIELFGPPSQPGLDSRNFVLCPGKAYDRSPCGTGTSAKLACLCADGRLREGQVWKQESIVGSVFEGSVVIEEGRIYPRIKGKAFVTAQSTLILDEADPFRMGIRP